MNPEPPPEPGDTAPHVPRQPAGMGGPPTPATLREAVPPPADPQPEPYETAPVAPELAGMATPPMLQPSRPPEPGETAPHVPRPSAGMGGPPPTPGEAAPPAADPRPELYETEPPVAPELAGMVTPPALQPSPPPSAFPTLREAVPPPDPSEVAPAPSDPTVPVGPPPREPFWGYSDVLLFAGLAIPCMLFGWALVQGILRLFHLHFAMHAAELLSEQLAGYALLFFALRLIFRVQYGRPFWVSLGWNKLHAPFLWLVIAGFAAAVAVTFATYLIRVPTTSNPMTELMRDRASIILLAIFGVTIGPLCEELVFRGFLQPLLVRSLGTVAGILAAAIPFGLLHIPEYGNSWRHGIVIGLAGAAFGWVRHATGSTKAATVMHASYNFLFFFVLLSQGRDLPRT